MPYVECIDSIESLRDNEAMKKEEPGMSCTRTRLEEAIIEATKRLYQAAPRQSMEPWLHLDLTTAQVKTLFVLADREPETIGQAAEMLGITLPTASHLVDKLVRAGFVERYEDPADRRRTLARPTVRGTDLIRSLHEFSASYLRSCIGQMSEPDLAALAQGLHGLAVAANEIKNDPTWDREAATAKEAVPA
jgi:MarR family transcriptional regulator, organic hydroperoxide resistance regulator